MRGCAYARGDFVAQDDNSGPGGPPGGGPGGNFDPAQFRQRMMEQAPGKNLDVTNDDEWTVIESLVQKLMDLRVAGSFHGWWHGNGFWRSAAGEAARVEPERARRFWGLKPSAEQKELQKDA